MIQDLLNMQYIALAFVAVMALLWIILESSRKPPSGRQAKQKPFACGMNVPANQLNVNSGSYYQFMKKLFLTGRLADIHSGKLSNYLAWIVIGLAIIMLLVVMFW
jgi:hypothetical protein